MTETAAKPRLEFWFEYASTYSYPAAMRIEAEAAKHGVEVEWKVLLLGPLFHAQQGLTDSPFNVVPIKGKYMWRDLARVCADLDFPLNKPDIFPQNTLKAARMTLALPVELRSAFAKAIYQKNFVSGADLSEPDVLMSALSGLAVDPDDIIERAMSAEVKSLLREQIQTAETRGIFGAPSFVASDGELFWGNDRLEMAVKYQSQFARDAA